jgi:putative ABC transport system permease protein
MRHDIALAFRRLVLQPAFTATAVLTMALGIGANTAVFSVIDAVLLRPMPFAEPGALVELPMVSRGGSYITSHQLDAVHEWRTQTDLFAAFEAYRPQPLVMVDGRDPVRIEASALTGGMMAMLGVAPAIGRLITDADAQPGRDPVVVISDALWRQRFARDRSIVGRRVRMDDGVYEVVGVMPASFRFPRATNQAWIALPLVAPPPGSGGFIVVARLAPNVTIDLALSRVQALAPAFAAWMPKGEGWSLLVRQFGESRANPGPRRALWIIAGAVALVLLIACANVANLLMARGAGRSHELAVRAAMGASRGRLIRELLAECALLSAVGGAAGIAVAYWGVGVLQQLTPSDLTFLAVSDIAVDGRGLAFSMAATLLAGVISGLVPAFRSTGREVIDPLRSAGRSATASPRQRRLGQLVVIAELALAVMLLTGASLLLRTFDHLTRIDPGFDTSNLIGITITLPESRYPNTAATTQFWTDLRDRAREVAGVDGVTIAPALPPNSGGFSFNLNIEAEGNPEIISDSTVVLPRATIRPEYFSVLRIPLLAGRTFTPEDGTVKPPPVIVNEALAGRLWPAGNAIGGRMRLDNDEPFREVVGIVGTVYQFDRTRSDQMGIYDPAGQSFGRFLTLTVRTAGDPAARVADLRAAIRAIDPSLPIYRIETATQAYATFHAAPRFYAVLLVVFAITGMALAAIGLYGVMAYATAQRMAEFGLRLALGAEPRDVLRLVMRQGLWIAAWGVAIGLAGAAAASGTLARLLVGVTPRDPGTFAAVALALAGVALAACWIPARRALRVDPVVALRRE